MSAYHFLVVDDHPFVRCGLSHTLQREFKDADIDEASNASAALEKAASKDYDLILLDINLPGRNGVVLLSELKKVCARVPVLMLSAYAEDRFAVRVLKAGASGFLSKDAPPSEFLSAVSTILSGRRYITPRVAQLLAEELNRRNGQPAHERLSDRELQVMLMLAQGKTATEIGKALGVSIKTVSTYRSRVLQKTNLKTNADLVQYALREKLLD